MRAALTALTLRDELILGLQQGYPVTTNSRLRGRELWGVKIRDVPPLR
jgi:hypothetical protein